MNDLFGNPLFGILLCVVCYWFGTQCARWLKTPLANPLMIAMILVILVLQCTPVTPEQFSAGGSVISMMLAPATAVIGAAIYREMAVLRRNLLPVLCGCLAGTVTSLVSILLLCRLFGLDEVLTASILPKSVTTPIAMEVAAAHGGIPAVAVAGVVCTGIFGACVEPSLIRLMGLNPVAAGVSLGASCHAIGTAKALEINDVAGAMSGIALGITGVMTVFCALLLPL